MSIAAKARARAAAAFPVDPTLPANLRRNAPLVPRTRRRRRSLAAVIAIPHLPRGPLRGRRRDGRRQCRPVADQRRAGVTIQVRPGPGRDVDADVAKAQAIAKDEPGIAQTRIFSKAESERLLEPWLGTGLDLTDLPGAASSPSGCRGSAPISAGCAPGSRTPCPASRAWTTTLCGCSGSPPPPTPSWARGRPRGAGAGGDRARRHLRHARRHGRQQGGGGGAPLRGRRGRLHRPRLPGPVLRPRPARRRHRGGLRHPRLHRRRAHHRVGLSGPAGQSSRPCSVPSRSAGAAILSIALIGGIASSSPAPFRASR